jgi:epoxyqueuosine reductase
MGSLREVVKAEAHRLGFDLVGVTTPDIPPHYGVYERWLTAGRHGEMGYLATERARQRRADPRLILPECRSILLLGIRYSKNRSESSLSLRARNPRGGQEEGDSGITGSVAAYAWGDDYHNVLPERLQTLVAFIEDQVGGKVPNRWYTDTGPILERDLAGRAGLGWIGKNTCLINPALGSYFLLAVILLGLDIESDQPFAHDRCGSCRRCIEACPTGCILPDRTIDSQRCISYLTIELKGIIPHDLRSLVGDWVFGCDVCQQVCPWNQRFAPSRGDPSFAPRSGLSRPDLIQELALTPQEFNLKFKGSPVKRAKRRGYLRNVAVALGNTGDPSIVPVLGQALLNDHEHLVRGHAAWALGCIGDENAIAWLEESASQEGDSYVLGEINLALKKEADI